MSHSLSSSDYNKVIHGLHREQGVCKEITYMSVMPESSLYWTGCCPPCDLVIPKPDMTFYHALITLHICTFVRLIYLINKHTLLIAGFTLPDASVGKFNLLGSMFDNPDAVKFYGYNGERLFTK